MTALPPPPQCQLASGENQDHVVESGEKFWTGAKRFPRAAELDVSAEQHTAFVLATANLLAAGCGLSPQEEGLLPLNHPQRNVECESVGFKELCRGSLLIAFFSLNYVEFELTISFRYYTNSSTRAKTLFDFNSECSTE